MLASPALASGWGSGTLVRTPKLMNHVSIRAPEEWRGEGGEDPGAEIRVLWVPPSRLRRLFRPQPWVGMRGPGISVCKLRRLAPPVLAHNCLSSLGEGCLSLPQQLANLGGRSLSQY